MAKIPVATAAKMANVQRSTLYRKNEKGEISFEKDESGNNTIDISELLRVYPNAKVETTDESDTQQPKKQQVQQEETPNESKLLQQEIKFLREKLEDKQQQLEKAEKREEDLSKKLDDIIAKTSEEKVLLLEDHSKREETLTKSLEEKDTALKIAEEAAEKKRGLLGWLRSS